MTEMVHAQKPVGKPSGMPPVGAQELLTALNDPARALDAKAMAQLMFRVWGKQTLMKGKAGARVEGTTVAWAVINEGPARVVDAHGALIGQMKSIGKDGLQVLALEMPNFHEIDYRIEVGGMTLLAGSTRIEYYPLPPEAKPDLAIPQGRLEKFEWKDSRVFPNTTRNVVVYIPSQYDISEPASLMVWQDGSRHADPTGGLRATVVMDHLIAKGEMPVTIGVFIDPGHTLRQKPEDAKAPNRGFEYDSLGSAYVTFVLNEILPQVKQRYSLNWSDKPEDHAIAGGSSGGICAFNAAWERPDQFRKVLSWVGSFVNLRGGHVYPAFIREAERKPLRVYLLDGSNDLDNPYGNWPIANKNMAASLKYMGYDYRFDFGQCFHGSKGMSASLPDAMRWLWRK
ncbi:MAG: putative esterase [Verrucomicrobiaceae bacterium]|nr:putative esterase [Verrucomicrobiaceae bacterium]